GGCGPLRAHSPAPHRRPDRHARRAWDWSCSASERCAWPAFSSSGVLRLDSLDGLQVVFERRQDLVDPRLQIWIDGAGVHATKFRDVLLVVLDHRLDVLAVEFLPLQL